MDQLFDYQAEDANWLVSTSRALLASEMGTGKTATLIAAANNSANLVVVVCPAIARSVWSREWARWGDKNWKIIRIDSVKDFPKFQKLNGLQRQVLIIGYDLFSRKDKGDSSSVIRRCIKTYCRSIDLVIADEAHYLKSSGSNRTKEVFSLLNLTPRMWLASGTPAPNHYGELYPMISNLWPASINGMDRTGFETKFCTTKTMWIQGREMTIISGSKNGADLKAILAPVMRRRTKAEVLKELPPMIFDTLPLENTTGSTTGFKRKHDFTDGADDDEILADINRNKTHLATERRELGIAKVNACVEWIVETLEPDPKKKLVVFAYHHEVLDKLYEMLAVYKPVLVDGRTPMKARLEAETAFQTGDARVFIGQIQAAGTSITLTAASDVLFVESDWVPSNNLQAASRCHRIGQRDNVIVRHAVMEGTLDERIGEALVRKERELAEIFC